MSRYDGVVIGAGIVGLATARELLLRRPGLRLAVVDKEPALAAHQSGHNSGVIHSGIYYTPGSLKARLCVAGMASMLRFCEEHGIAVRRCGKLIVATRAEELPRLHDLHRRGQANGVPGLALIEADRIAEIEPHAVGVAALHGPATSIVDYRQVCAAMAADVRAAGGELLLGREVLEIRHARDAVTLVTPHEELTASWLVACAGLWSDEVAHLDGQAPQPAIVPFRGSYWRLRADRRSLVRGLIYPVPDPAFPFLGVHFTPRMDGEVWLGPNAVLALGRDAYRRRDVDPGELARLARHGGLRRFGARYWRVGVAEVLRDLLHRRLVEELRRYVPELRPEDVLSGPSGIRAQAMGEDGTLIDDFVIDTGARSIHVRNAPSPAATSSLEIARAIADRAQAHFALVG